MSFHIGYLPSGISSVYNEVSVQIFGLFFNESIVYLALCSFQVYSKVIQLHTYICMCMYTLLQSLKMINFVMYILPQ